MDSRLHSLWQRLSVAQQRQVIAILVQMLLRRWVQQQKEGKAA
jgi:hypothetical protein